jgi:hypothetical protein
MSAFVQKKCHFGLRYGTPTSPDLSGGWSGLQELPGVGQLPV